MPAAEFGFELVDVADVIVQDILDLLENVSSATGTMPGIAEDSDWIACDPWVSFNVKDDLSGCLGGPHAVQEEVQPSGERIRWRDAPWVTRAFRDIPQAGVAEVPIQESMQRPLGNQEDNVEIGSIRINVPQAPPAVDGIPRLPIAILVGEAASASSARSAVKLAQTFRQRGHRVIAVMARAPAATKLFQAQDVPTLRVQAFDVIGETCKILEGCRPVVVLYTPDMHETAHKIKTLRGVPIQMVAPEQERSA